MVPVPLTLWAGMRERLTILLGAGEVVVSKSAGGRRLSFGTGRWPWPGSRAGLPRKCCDTPTTCNSCKVPAPALREGALCVGSHILKLSHCHPGHPQEPVQLPWGLGGGKHGLRGAGERGSGRGGPLKVENSGWGVDEGVDCKGNGQSDEAKR